MRKIALLFGVSLFMLACSNEGSNSKDSDHQHKPGSEKQAKDTSKKSIPSETIASINNTDIRINYHAPAVRGRVIWGGLVPYDAVWVTGAHSATTLEVGKEFRVDDKMIPAGKYAIFTIPGKADWVVIINRNWDQHLADDYSETQDLIRVKVKPDTLAQISERLSYDIEPIGETQARISMSWEKLRIQFSLEVR